MSIRVPRPSGSAYDDTARPDAIPVPDDPRADRPTGSPAGRPAPGPAAFRTAITAIGALAAVRALSSPGRLAGFRYGT